MAEVSFSIADLAKALWGKDLEVQFDAVVGDGGSLGAGKSVGRFGSNYWAKDAVTGREVYLPCRLTYSGGTTNVGGAVTSLPDKEFYLPHAIVGITSRKNIVETVLTERNSPVRELINVSGYEITVRGIAFNKDNELPEDVIAELMGVYRAKGNVRLFNVLTDLVLMEFDRQCVVKDFRLLESHGVKHVKGYELSLVSDGVFSLEEV